MSFQEIPLDELDSYKKRSELPHHWHKRREFLRQNNGKFTIDRLVSLSHAYINIEEFDSTYSDEIMQIVSNSKPKGYKNIALRDYGFCKRQDDYHNSDEEALDDISDNPLLMDYHQSVARSSYADMLHDDERNKAFDEAIKKCVFTLVHSKEFNPTGDRHFKCCDIGTGSGLLSMMIVRAFLDLSYTNFHIIAFEAFYKMATCAESIIQANGFSEYITVIKNRSDKSDIKSPQFDLLVAELLDTELIGEGCIGAYRHAVEKLCSPKCLFVPHQARIYIEPVESSTLFARNSLDDLKINLGSDSTRRKLIHIKVPVEIKKCCGNQAIDDMQASALREGKDFIRISEPKVAFEITFNDLSSLKLRDDIKIDFSIKKDIEQPPVIVMWWDIIMFDKSQMQQQNSNENHDDNDHNNGKVNNIEPDLEVLSCAPIWARDQNILERDNVIEQIYGRSVWREHWIQGVYYFADVQGTKALVGRKSDSHLIIYAYHDDFSLWFDLQACDTKLPHSCNCNFHRVLDRAELSLLSDTDNMKKLLASWLHNEYRSELECELQIEKKEATQGPKWQINVIENEGRLSRPIKPLLDPEFEMECPWRKAMIWFRKHQSNMGIIESFEIKFTQVHFDNLNRICMDRKICEGFDLSLLDNMIKENIEIVDKVTETHYLWEYGGRRSDREDHVLFSLPKDGNQALERVKDGFFQRRFKPTIYKRDIPNLKDGLALVFWVEFKLAKTGVILSTGPAVKSSTAVGSLIEWNRNFKQIVYFLHNKPEVDIESQLYFGVDLGFNVKNLNLKIKIIS